MALDRGSPGETPVSGGDGATTGLGQRVAPEVFADILIKVTKQQRITETRTHGVISRGRCRRRRRGRSQDRIDDQIDGDDVDDPVRRGGEIRQLPTAVGEDQRLGHLEALDPARERAGQRALDDGRTHDGQRQSVTFGFQITLGEGLGERVAVRPAQNPGPLAARVDEPALHPPAAAAFGFPGDRLRAGPDVFSLGLGPEPAQLRRGPRGVLGREPGSLRGGLLGPPVDVVHEAALSHMPRSQPGHVCRGDVHQMRSGTAVSNGPQQLLDAPEVHGETRVDRRVERHLAGAVDDDVDIRRNGRDPFKIAFKDRDPVA